MSSRSETVQLKRCRHYSGDEIEWTGIFDCDETKFADYRLRWSRELIFSFCVDQDAVRRSWKTKFDSVQPRVNVRSTRILFLKADCDGSAWIDPFTRDPCDYSHAEWWFAEFETLQFDPCGILWLTSEDKIDPYVGILLRHFDRWNGNCCWSVSWTRIVEMQLKNDIPVCNNWRPSGKNNPCWNIYVVNCWIRIVGSQ